jgi:hypothetical protein
VTNPVPIPTHETGRGTATVPLPPSSTSGKRSRPNRPRCRALLCTILVAIAAPAAASTFAGEVVSFQQGIGGGFNAELLPDIVLGPPHGAGATQGSLHVLSLGHGGVITLRFTDSVICDGPGPDLIVFENAFHAGEPSGPVFVEAGIVAVSQDGVTFFEFPYDVDTYAGLAGKGPVLSNPENGIDPCDAEAAGGDAFDLADLGLEWVAYVRVTDGGDDIPDPGNRLPGGTVSGFDLDAIAAVHACEPGSTPSATPTATSTPPVDATAPSPAPSPTPSPPEKLPTATSDATETSGPLAGDMNGDGRVDEHDALHSIHELFDGDGDAVADVAGGIVASPPGVDANGDGRVTVADVIAILRHASD